MYDYTKINQYLEKNLDASIAELSRLCAQPSVGAQNWGLIECAELVAEMLQQRNFSLVLPTGGDLYMLGKESRQNRPFFSITHCKSQPPEPWIVESLLFEPTIREELCRGVSDKDI
jgi:hypothetical protein